MRKDNLCYAAGDYRSIWRENTGFLDYEQTGTGNVISYRPCHACFLTCADRTVRMLFLFSHAENQEKFCVTTFSWGDNPPLKVVLKYSLLPSVSVPALLPPGM